MNRRHVIGAILVVLLLGVAGGVALFTGVGPVPGGADDDEQLTDFPTATSHPEPNDSVAPPTSNEAATEVQPFSFTIDRIEECGVTCRDVTATLHNTKDETATGVTVYSRIFAGQDNSDPDDIVWEGTQDVGALEAGGSYTSTRRVELSLQESVKIQSSNGWITIITTVESDADTVTFRDSMQVA